MITFMERDVEMVIEPECVLRGEDWIEKHVQKLMSGSETRIDVLGVTCSRLYAYIVQPEVEPKDDAVKNFQDFITMGSIPEDMRHNLCMRIARTRDDRGRVQRWIMHNDKLKKLIMEVV